MWAEGNIARSTARASIGSPSAINLICPAELVLVVHKGEWNLGRTDASGLGHDEWLAWTLAAWSFPGEHAERVGHPAAFPAELPRRLIKLLSFPGDLIIDPFVSSGTTAVVARALRRRFWGCDRNPIAVALAQAQARVAVAEIHASRPADAGLEALHALDTSAFEGLSPAPSRTSVARRHRLWRHRGSALARVSSAFRASVPWPAAVERPLE